MVAHRFRLLAVLAAAAIGAAAAGEPRAVEMTTADGKRITGLLYGSGATGLVLCHGRMYLKGAESFAKECDELSAKGLMCLAINFRGYPAERPPDLPGMEEDVVAGFEFLVGRGAKRVFILGGSMGGMAALRAASKLDGRKEFAGSIILSAFDTVAAKRLRVPKLLVVAYDDRRVYTKMMAMLFVAPPPKEAVVFARGGHGQRLFQAHHNQLIEVIHNFVARYSEGR